MNEIEQAERETDRASIRSLTEDNERLRTELADVRAERDELEEEITAAAAVIDAALVDPDAPEDTGEADDAGELVDAAQAVTKRLRLAEAEVVRLATEVERLSDGEMPLPGAPALTGGAPC